MQKLISSITLSAALAAVGIAGGLLLGSAAPSDAGNATLTPKPPVVRDHRTQSGVRDHRTTVRDHRGGKVPAGDKHHTVPCLGNLC